MVGRWPDDDDSVDDLEAIALGPLEAAARPQPEVGDDEDRSPRGRRLLVLALVAAIGAIGVVSIAVTRDGTDAEAKPEGRGPPSAAPTAAVPPTLELEPRPPPTTPGDASTTAPLLPEGAPSTPDVGELVASDMNSYGGGVRGAGGSFGAYFLYTDGRLIWASDPRAHNPAFVEQRLTPEGVEQLRSKFLATGPLIGFDAAAAPPQLQIALCDDHCSQVRTVVTVGASQVRVSERLDSGLAAL